MTERDHESVSDLGAEVPVEDAVEQQQPAARGYEVDDGDGADPADEVLGELADLEADPADRVEQARTVTLDDDEYR